MAGFQQQKRQMSIPRSTTAAIVQAMRPLYDRFPINGQWELAPNTVFFRFDRPIWHVLNPTPFWGIIVSYPWSAGVAIDQSGNMAPNTGAPAASSAENIIAAFSSDNYREHPPQGDYGLADSGQYLPAGEVGVTDTYTGKGMQEVGYVPPGYDGRVYAGEDVYAQQARRNQLLEPRDGIRGQKRAAPPPKAAGILYSTRRR